MIDNILNSPYANNDIPTQNKFLNQFYGAM